MEKGRLKSNTKEGENKERDGGSSDNMIKNATNFRSLQIQLAKEYPEWPKERVLPVALGMFREQLKNYFDDSEQEYSAVDREFFKAIGFAQGLATGQTKLLDEDKILGLGPWYKGLPKFLLVWLLVGISPPLAVSAGWGYTKWGVGWKWLLTILCAFAVFAQPHRFQPCDNSSHSTLHRIQNVLSN